MIDSRYLAGQFLIAMPRLTERPFARALIYLCAHSHEGAMGLIVNQRAGVMKYHDIFHQLEVATNSDAGEACVHFGGPVEPSRGFVLHSTDRLEEGSMVVSEDVALTSTIDILRAIAEGHGPRRVLLALGYAGWTAGQLDQEIQNNAWLLVEPDDALLFDADLDTKWHRAIAKLGVDITMLSSEAGHA